MAWTAERAEYWAKLIALREAQREHGYDDEMNDARPDSAKVSALRDAMESAFRRWRRSVPAHMPDDE